MRTMILLGIFLTSCKTIPPTPVYQVNLKNEICTIYCWDYNNQKILDDFKCGDEFQSGPSPLWLCDHIVGPKIQDYSQIIKPIVKKNIEACEDKESKID